MGTILSAIETHDIIEIVGITVASLLSAWAVVAAIRASGRVDRAASVGNTLADSANAIGQGSTPSRNASMTSRSAKQSFKCG